MSAPANTRVRSIEHRDPLGLRPLRRLPATPCVYCDRASVVLGRIGQNLCREHARIHYGIARQRRRRGQSWTSVALLSKWRGGAG